jgi:hypothetical protein
MRTLALLAAFGLAVASPASPDSPDLSGFDRVLLPIFLPDPKPGPRHSTQVTGREVRLFSRGELLVFPHYSSPSSPPAAATLSPEFPFLRLEGPASGGRFVFIASARSDDVWFRHQLTVADREGEAKRVSLPVVAEAEALTGNAFILGVPFEWRLEGEPFQRKAIPLYRRTLRVYSFDDQPGARITVRLYVEPLGPNAAVFKTYELSLARRDGDDPSFPYHGVLNFADICLPVSRQTPCMPAATFRVELEPQTEALRYWAFVTAIERFSEHVLVLTPEQPIAQLAASPDRP